MMSKITIVPFCINFVVAVQYNDSKSNVFFYSMKLEWERTRLCHKLYISDLEKFLHVGNDLIANPTLTLWMTSFTSNWKFMVTRLIEYFKVFPAVTKTSPFPTKQHEYIMISLSFDATIWHSSSCECSSLVIPRED